TPAHIDLDKLREELLAAHGVVGVHDLHVWTITSGMYALSCHVVVHPDQYTVAKLEEIRRLLHHHSEILHQTVQLETEELADEEAIHL
ncbi:MAG TPA: cation transporter, partial [Armatimonadota bacterium]|nr:cation transporter [Armatimonadota bacterium]